MCGEVDVCGVVVVPGGSHADTLITKQWQVEVQMRPAMGISRLQNNVMGTMSSKML